MSMLTDICKNNRSLAHSEIAHNDFMALKERIREARTTSGLNKSELARLCGVDTSAINKLESGDTKKISGELLLKISSAIP